MAKRPTPTVNALAGATIYQAPQTSVTPPSSSEATQRDHTQERTRISIRGEREFMDRARAAWFNNIQQTGIMSFNDYVIEALQVRIQQDEQTYNNGQPYEGRPPGTTPIGRR